MLLLPPIAIGALHIEAEIALIAATGSTLKKTAESVAMFRKVASNIPTDERKAVFYRRTIECYRRVK
jgi:hypothetical protein